MEWSCVKQSVEPAEQSVLYSVTECWNAGRLERWSTVAAEYRNGGRAEQRNGAERNGSPESERNGANGAEPNPVPASPCLIKAGEKLLSSSNYILWNFYQKKHNSVTVQPSRIERHFSAL